ncbi:unnamed protein product, partial [Larinioides sclopetarius]
VRGHHDIIADNGAHHSSYGDHASKSYHDTGAHGASGHSAHGAHSKHGGHGYGSHGHLSSGHGGHVSSGLGGYAAGHGVAGYPVVHGGYPTGHGAGYSTGYGSSHGYSKKEKLIDAPSANSRQRRWT